MCNLVHHVLCKEAFLLEQYMEYRKCPGGVTECMFVHDQQIGLERELRESALGLEVPPHRHNDLKSSFGERMR